MSPWRCHFASRTMHLLVDCTLLGANQLCSGSHRTSSRVGGGGGGEREDFRLKWNLLKNFEFGFQFCHHSWRCLGDSIVKVVFSERRIGKLDSCNSNWRLNLVLMINKHSCMYKKIKQSLYRPGQALKVLGVWRCQTSRQSAHEGGKVSPTYRTPLLPGIFSFILEDESFPGS